MSRQSLPQLIVEAQQLLTQIPQHSQYQALQFNCDITLGDVSQFFNTLQSECQIKGDSHPLTPISNANHLPTASGINI
ncbi:MAG: hypothetical protein KME50_24515 [Nostoc desertorum CM1-VF14]|jgi:hypothetical protein|nr:hypothetical protein [Nostoc desertorum CM1-VF14]